MPKLNIAINGFGRIGRAAFKAILEKNDSLKVVAINDLTDTETLAHLLRHDTCYGDFLGDVKAMKNGLMVDGVIYSVFAEKEPEKLPWKELGVDVVIESTGRFRKMDDAGLHIAAGAKKVIVSAPGKGMKTIVLGVNEDKLTKKDKVFSNASCTTNCLAPVVEVIRKEFGIEKAMMTTIHSYTADQNLVDAPHKDLRRARAAAMNMVPTTTGAAIATGEVIPDVAGKFDGFSMRVPTPVVSVSDVVFVTKKKVDEKMVNNALKKASKSAKLKGILEVTDEELVSSDFIGHPASSIVDAKLTKVVGGNLLKVVAWYDNEWGYSCRLADLCEYMGKKRLV